MSTQLKQNRGEKGQAIVLLVLLLVGLIGITALAVDGGRLYSDRRRAQNAADNAALAGAYAVCAGGDVGATARAAALNNGFNNDGSTNTVTIHHPPSGGPYSGNNQYVITAISSTQATTFARLIYSGNLVVTTRATARCRDRFEYALVALNGSNTVRGLSIIGNGDVVVNGGGAVSNSTHPTQSLYETGSGTFTADPIDIVGGIQGDGFLPDPPNSPADPVTDPLADVQPPPKPAGACTTVDLTGSGSITLDPGLYCEITAASNINIFMNPGIYYIDGPGGFSVSSNASIIGAGVLIYLGENAAGVTIIGNGSINLTAPASGPYAGLLFYVDRNNTNPINGTGNGSWSGTGTIYAPSSDITLSGDSGTNTYASMIIGSTVSVGGNGNFVVYYDPGLNFGADAIYLIE